VTAATRIAAKARSFEICSGKDMKPPEILSILPGERRDLSNSHG
jgi:hypothetical protein